MFERYTEEARRAIFFARAESLFRKAPAISVQDLLLGLTREKKSRANYISELSSHAAEFRLHLLLIAVLLIIFIYLKSQG
jgi:hypothetical protein